MDSVRSVASTRAALRTVTCACVPGAVVPARSSRQLPVARRLAPPTPDGKERTLHSSRVPTALLGGKSFHRPLPPHTPYLAVRHRTFVSSVPNPAQPGDPLSGTILYLEDSSRSNDNPSRKKRGGRSLESKSHAAQAPSRSNDSNNDPFRAWLDSETDEQLNDGRRSQPRRVQFYSPPLDAPRRLRSRRSPSLSDAENFSDGAASSLNESHGSNIVALLHEPSTQSLPPVAHAATSSADAALSATVESADRPLEMNALPQSASILATSAESGAGVEQNPYTGSNSSNFLSPPSVTTSFNTEQAPPHIPSSQSSTHVHPQPLVFPPSISPQPSPLEPDLLSRTFYRRALPPNLISFTSTHGKRLFREALLDGRGESYFSLVGNFTSQSHPALCGLGSLAMVLNALEVDPKRRWKGVWRWWSDEMLNLCTPLSKIQRRGVTFRDFECIAKRNGLTVIPRRYDNTTYIEFLQDIELTSTSPDVLMVASFSRKAMGCTGDGHFSPVCAYHRGEDRVLVLDVARFKYPSYFASTRELYEAMKPIDKETNLPRGYFLLRRGTRPAEPLCKVAVAPPDRSSLSTLLTNSIPSYLAAVSPLTLEDVVRTVLASIPDDYRFLVSMQGPGVDLAGGDEQRKGLVERHKRMVDELVEEAKRNGMFTIVENVAGGGACIAGGTGGIVQSNSRDKLQGEGEGTTTDGASRDRKVALATIFMLASPREMYQSLPPHLWDQFVEFRKAVEAGGKGGRLLRAEVGRVQAELAALMNEGCQCRQDDVLTKTESSGGH